MSTLNNSGSFSQKLSQMFYAFIQREQLLSPMPEITVAPTRDVRLLRRFHRDILQTCFYAADMDTPAEFVANVFMGDYVVLLVQEGSDILGGIVIEHSWSTGKKIMLIAWIAVNESYRGRNIGTLLIEEALSYARSNGALLLLGEVENPDVFDEEFSAHGNPVKRVKFYSRFGCQRLEVPYVVPSLSPDEEQMFGIMLTMFPLSAEQATATEFSLPELAIFVEEFVGIDSAETLALAQACKGPVALTPYANLF